MVGHDARGVMLPFMLIAQSGTHAGLQKFVQSNPDFNYRGGGVPKAGASDAATARYTRATKGGAYAYVPPYFIDTECNIVCAGDPTHWMNASTLRLWIDLIVVPGHEAQCKAHGLDPAKAKSIVHFDAYPVHISAEFLDWIKRTFPFLILIYVPANCTSKMQVADVALNRPLKADYTNRHMRFLATVCREQMAAGVEAAQVRFETAVSKCAGAALSWLVAAYRGLGKVNMQKALQNIGYTKCWDDEELRQRAMDNMSKLFPGGSADPHVPDEPDEQLALDADDDALLDEGGKVDVEFLVE